MTAVSAEFVNIAMAIGDTLPVVSVKFLDESGSPCDDISSVDLTLFSAVPDAAPVTVGGVAVPDETGRYTFSLSGKTITADTFTTDCVVVTPGGQATLGGPTIVVVVTSELWATPAMIAEAAPGHSNAELLLAIHMSEVAVREWVATPVTSPVPERVRQAVALLAIRSLTTTPGAGPAILGETMGDYSVRFAHPGAQGGFAISGEVEELLRPWGHPRVASTYIGPDDVTTIVVPEGIPEVIF